MHAVKRLALQNLNRQGRRVKLDYDQHVELAKLDLRKQFETLSASDKLFSSMFKLIQDHRPLGVGSFGMVLLAEATADITAGGLARAQAVAAAAATPPLPASSSWPRWRLQQQQRSPADADHEALLSNQASKKLVLARGQLVAVKFEYNVDKRKRKFQLTGEFCLLTELFNCYGSALEGFPEPYLFGSLQPGLAFIESGMVYRCHHYLVMELLGDSLRARFDDLPPPPRTGKSNGSTAFPVPFVFDVAKQLLTRLMLLHAEPICVTHNDLKLDQLMLGRGDKSNIVYLVDYGLAFKYKNAKTRSRWGNRRYASRFSHEGVNSPLTDLESAAYIVARFLRNSFPWDGMQGADSESRRRGMARLKTKLWLFVESMRRGRCLQQQQINPDFSRMFFADRTDAKGRGGPQLLKYMSRLAEYTKNQTTAAENIDYNYLFNCFVLPNDIELQDAAG